jgi:hypothetical protein
MHVHLLLRLHDTTGMITHVHRYMPVTFRYRGPEAMIITVSGRPRCDLGPWSPTGHNCQLPNMHCR